MAFALTPRAGAVLLALASAALLLGAHAFERLGDLAPCPLCLVQREVLWTSLAVAALAALTPRAATRTLMIGAGAILAAGFLLAGSHAGAERGFWPGPAQCAAAVGADAPAPAADLLGALQNPGDTPACDEAPIRIVGLSLADLNALISAGLALFAVTLSFRTRITP